jgi:outer membrane protein insertion porin family
MPKFKHALITLLLLLPAMFSQAQIQLGGDEEKIDYANPREYELGGITVSGVQFLDENVLITLTGLTVGQRYKIPGEKIAQAIENLWKQGLLADIRINVKRISGDRIFLELAVQERPRLSKFSFEGVTKGEADKLREKLQLVKGKVVTENLMGKQGKEGNRRSRRERC